VLGRAAFEYTRAVNKMLTFLLNGIAWAAHLEIPKRGVESPTPDVSDVTPRAAH
jgi:hypothetical protein